MMDANCRTRWEHLVKIHFLTKGLILRAEELEFWDHKTYIQPIREERDAFEHVCRGVADYLGLKSPKTGGDYLSSTLEAARKHTVRAFFDAADWYGSVLRTGIRTRLSPYSSQTIRSAIPDYFTGLMLRIDEIIDRIVQCREEKDASDEPGTYQEAKTYADLVLELEGVYRRVSKAIPALEQLHTEELARLAAEREEAEKKRREDRRASYAIKVAAGVTVAAILTIVGTLFAYSQTTSSTEEHELPAVQIDGQSSPVSPSERE